jgi:hypothetical protein
MQGSPVVTNAPEIKEMFSTVREILREHRRMALYASVYARELQTENKYSTWAHDAAVNAVLAFDNMFKEPS